MGFLRKPDPIAAAQAEIDKLTAQRARLADRLAGAVAAVEAAVRHRHEALTDADPTAAEMAKLNRAAADAAEARSGIEEASRTVQMQLDEAATRLAGLRDAATRARLAADAETRAKALDAAGEALAAAAQAFGAAREDMVRAIAEHGIRVDNLLTSDGSTPAAVLATPVIRAALRMAAPSLHPAADGLGKPYDSDPLMVVRRAQSGRLRDFADDVVANRVPAAEMPRPGQAPLPVDPNDPLSVKVERVAGVFREPFSYLAVGGTMIHGEPGQNDVPAVVLRVAIEMDIAAEPDTPQANAILLAIKADTVRPSYVKARPGAPGTRRMFIDTDSGVVDSAPARSVAWPDANRQEARAWVS